MFELLAILFVSFIELSCKVCGLFLKGIWWMFSLIIASLVAVAVMVWELFKLIFRL